MVREYYEDQLKKKVLIILHQRRIVCDDLSAENQELVQKWKTQHAMYNCEKGNNDDWYWLSACLQQENSCFIVSNDEMRDHHFQMIQPTYFTQWKERHLIHYQFKEFQNQMKQFLPKEPSTYSKRSQVTNKIWYFPNHNVTKWLCCIPVPEKQ